MAVASELLDGYFSKISSKSEETVNAEAEAACRYVGVEFTADSAAVDWRHRFVCRGLVWVRSDGGRKMCYDSDESIFQVL